MIIKLNKIIKSKRKPGVLYSNPPTEPWLVNLDHVTDIHSMDDKGSRVFLNTVCWDNFTYDNDVKEGAPEQSNVYVSETIEEIHEIVQMMQDSGIRTNQTVGFMDKLIKEME